MEKTACPDLAAVATAGLLWLLAGCQPHEPEARALAPLSTDLMGRWRYDSAGAAFYDRRGHFSHRFMDPLPPGAWLTIGPKQWTYSGSVREAHAYIRQGNTVRVRRVVDTALVRAGHARREEVGAFIGLADTLLLTTLTRHRLVLRDSATDPDGALTRVWRYYYSR
ncbi:hypothetical protein D0N36_14665 [Hymenobacter lapidiphilus]|uniref:hypothetical protein n=1 Tax=Hymenobacter sp. CCM 8763 TaxID=2303334 RepID=UPI000E349BDD|nr:hypothetical protein [Hymenobacter sp. CCM 8763]RFP64299.1 hypothetical protein D0N36_14665 [Hymenobacter sp. CCM 8763]